MTARELVRDVAQAHGVTLTDDEVEHILWEHAGNPAFWPEGSETAEAALRHQLADYFGGTG